ncbi:hypothetical protein OE88DRAFT_1186768 [Heliocybe sulcata]|uniref:Uncharacterized protein n=1 Tax=Heliocybe sulcata TaxID=5364 RepID=A0A5C3N932_9AGAM|nr:hypothetical protein OE88DRAFT_1186768 [Heliocybe sulcata]
MAPGYSFGHLPPRPRKLSDDFLKFVGIRKEEPSCIPKATPESMIQDAEQGLQRIKAQIRDLIAKDPKLGEPKKPLEYYDDPVKKGEIEQLKKLQRLECATILWIGDMKRLHPPPSDREVRPKLFGLLPRPLRRRANSETSRPAPAPPPKDVSRASNANSTRPGHRRSVSDDLVSPPAYSAECPGDSRGLPLERPCLGSATPLIDRSVKDKWRKPPSYTYPRVRANSAGPTYRNTLTTVVGPDIGQGKASDYDATTARAQEQSQIPSDRNQVPPQALRRIKARVDPHALRKHTDDQFSSSVSGCIHDRQVLTASAKPAAPPLPPPKDGQRSRPSNATEQAKMRTPVMSTTASHVTGSHSHTRHGTSSTQYMASTARSARVEGSGKHVCTTQSAGIMSSGSQRRRHDAVPGTAHMHDPLHSAVEYVRATIPTPAPSRDVRADPDKTHKYRARQQQASPSDVPFPHSASGRPSVPIHDSHQMDEIDVDRIARTNARCARWAAENATYSSEQLRDSVVAHNWMREDLFNILEQNGIMDTVPDNHIRVPPGDVHGRAEPSSLQARDIANSSGRQPYSQQSSSSRVYTGPDVQYSKGGFYLSKNSRSHRH